MQRLKNKGFGRHARVFIYTVYYDWYKEHLVNRKVGTYNHMRKDLVKAGVINTTALMEEGTYWEGI